nr:MAG TPA: S-Ribosylhomocysteinase (LuxS) [Caudoviricetes sp.]
MIPSFKVDHTKLKPGLYVSRVDKWGIGDCYNIRYSCVQAK